MSEPDPKRIAREWNREIEADIRRRAQRRDEGPWKIVVWLLLAAMWFAALYEMVAWLRPLHW